MQVRGFALHTRRYLWVIFFFSHSRFDQSNALTDYLRNKERSEMLGDNLLGSDIFYRFTDTRDTFLRLEPLPVFLLA